MPLELTPIPASELSPAVARVVQGPGPAKMMAARGMAPMGPRDLLTVLYQLTLDGDSAVAQAAARTGEQLPDNILRAALGEPLDARVLDYFAAKVVQRGELVEKVLLNKAVHDETMVFLAGKLAERELEILAGNQERMLRCPAIIVALYFNQQTRMSTVKGLLELAVRHDLTLDLPMYAEIRASILGEAKAAPPAATAEQATEAAQLKALENDMLDEAFGEAMRLGDDEEVGALEYGEEESKAKQPDPKQTNLLARPFIEKMRLATAGRAYHRSVLIRDTNKQIAMAVIRSPLMTEQEAARFSTMRALSEEVIRYIAHKKEWQKSYAVKLGLVQNPKCPLADSMRMLTHLLPSDLRDLARSKNVPASLAQAAKQLLHKRR